MTLDNDTSCYRTSRPRISGYSCWNIVHFSHNLSNSSRRGALESNEIEIIVTHPSYTDKKDEKVKSKLLKKPKIKPRSTQQNDNKGQIEDRKLLKSIIDKLHSSGHVTDDINIEPDKYDGISQLPPLISSSETSTLAPHRRIKFILVHWDSFVFTQLHATGSPAFMTHVREQAARMGYRLYPDKLEKRSKTALEVFGVDGLKFMVEDDDHEEERKEGDLVLVDSEEDLFRFLRMKYVPPYQRNW